MKMTKTKETYIALSAKPTSFLQFPLCFVQNTRTNWHCPLLFASQSGYSLNQN